MFFDINSQIKDISTMTILELAKNLKNEIQPDDYSLLMEMKD